MAEQPMPYRTSCMGAAPAVCMAAIFLVSIPRQGRCLVEFAKPAMRLLTLYMFTEAYAGSSSNDVNLNGCRSEDVSRGW